jgi:hypothetical protein
VLKDQPGLRLSMAKAGRQFALHRWERTSVLSQMERELVGLTDQKTPHSRVTRRRLQPAA